MRVDDFQAEEVYAASNVAEDRLVDLLEPEMLEHMDPADVPGFVRTALAAAGLEGDVPPIIFDVSADDYRAGWHEGRTGTIHLHPLTARPWVILHELAHNCDPRDRHGPRFCAYLLLLVQGCMGHDVADMLHECFTEHEVVVDTDFLD